MTTRFKPGPRTPIYSFRPECSIDLIQAAVILHTVARDGWSLRRVTVFDEYTGSVGVELLADLSLEQLRAILRLVPDGHVMVETLRPVPLAENTLEREPDLSRRP